MTIQYPITVVVPTYNRLDQVKECLANLSVAGSAHGAVTIVIVDNGSTDGTWEWLSLNTTEKLVLKQSHGVTISALRNLGAEMATGEYISFVDSDCLVPPDYFQRAEEVFASVDADMVGSMYGLPPDVHWIERTWMRLNCPARSGYTKLLPGGSMIVRSAMFRRVGGFDESLVTGEDAEFCERIIDAGGRIYESERMILIHLRNMSSISGFFRKQAWHGMGMFGSSRWWRPDRVTQMTLAHLVLSLAAVVWIPLGSGPLALRSIVALALLSCVPSVSVIYRVFARGGEFIPLRGMLLYAVYFYARAWSLIRLAAGSR